MAICPYTQCDARSRCPVCGVDAYPALPVLGEIFSGVAVLGLAIVLAYGTAKSIEVVYLDIFADAKAVASD